MTPSCVYVTIIIPIVRGTFAKLFESYGNINLHSPTSGSIIRHRALQQRLPSSCGREFWPMTLTFELDLDSVMMNQRARYLGQMSFHCKVISRNTDGYTQTNTHTHTHTHTLQIALLGPLKWSVKILAWRPRLTRTREPLEYAPWSWARFSHEREQCWHAAPDISISGAPTFQSGKIEPWARESGARVETVDWLSRV